MNVLIDGVEYEPVRKPLAYVEGKPVFVGDVIYTPDDHQMKITDGVISAYGWPFHKCSWNPPKPKTLMVELPFEQAEIYADSYKDSAFTDGMLARAINKAIEKEKQK